MIWAWAVYALVVGVLVSVAAWLAEQGARAQGWPARWIWAGALAVSAGGPLMAWLLPSGATAPAPFVGAPGAFVLGSLPVMTGAPAASAGPSAGMLILVAWLASSTLLLSSVAMLAIRLRLRLRQWPRRVVDGVEVRVSRSTGPAAIGVVRGRVVVPEWALSLGPIQRRLLLLHEAEHVRARDPQLALAALVLCALVPWHLPLWWQLRRLRMALEMDCDARVLRRSPHPGAYGSLLVAVGQRKAHLALALVESRSLLERRIRAIAAGRARATPLRAAALAGLSAVVLAAACETPGPTGPASVDQRPLGLDEARLGVEGMECAPAIYINGERGSLEAEETDNVEAVHVFKGPEAAAVRGDGEACGVVVVRTKDASVEQADAARRLVERLTAARQEPSAVEDRREPMTLDKVRDEPTFTPMTVQPRLKNPGEVQEALHQLYPPLLREAGIGGRVSVWFLIDREGVVDRTLIRTPSGHQALDAAALAVAERMEFTPAYNREERVPVWVALDIDFESDVGEGDEQRAAGADPAMERRVEGQARQGSQEPGATAAAARGGQTMEEPTFTPMTAPPRLQNVEETQRLLQAHYPPMLRTAGIGGTASVWFYIDEGGRVVTARIRNSSGHEALDEAALAVARQMDFQPARNGDQSVAVWVALSISFEPQ